MTELNTHQDDEDFVEGLADAIDAASDRNQITYLTDGTGKRIAAITPVEVAERHEEDYKALYRDIFGPAACSACKDGRHEDCPRHHRGCEEEGRKCACDQRGTHAHILTSQVALYRTIRNMR